MQKYIKINATRTQKLAKEFKISAQSVYAALRFETNSGLAKTIRAAAMQRGGVVFEALDDSKVGRRVVGEGVSNKFIDVGKVSFCRGSVGVSTEKEQELEYTPNCETSFKNGGRRIVQVFSERVKVVIDFDLANVVILVDEHERKRYHNLTIAETSKVQCEAECLVSELSFG